MLHFPGRCEPTNGCAHGAVWGEARSHKTNHRNQRHGSFRIDPVGREGDRIKTAVLGVEQLDFA